MIRASQLRVVPFYSDLGPDIGVAQIKLPGESFWRALCRTDECDDVCTGECISMALAKRRSKSYWCREAKIGARIYDDRLTFAVIDSCTDG